MQITSPHFPSGASIPKRFTCDGEEVNPELDIAGTPEDARSLALIVEDPDAPAGIWTHWLVWNIPPEVMRIESGSLPVGSIEGENSSYKSAYQGPCPPNGTHRYIFTLYALDIMLDLESGADKETLREKMQSHIIAEAELVGLYCRNEK